MSLSSEEIYFLVLQFLQEELFLETAHALEQESGLYFNMSYFEELVHAGDWDLVEWYLSGFTNERENAYSMKIFFEIQKQRYLEALDKQDRREALEILIKNLKVFSSFNEELYKELSHLLTLDNFRQNEQLSNYGDTKSMRNIMLLEVKKLIAANPTFRDMLTFPVLEPSRLTTLVYQRPPNGPKEPPPVSNPVVGTHPKSGSFPNLGALGQYLHATPPSTSVLAGWTANSSLAAQLHPSFAAGAISAGPSIVTGQPNQASLLKRPRTRSEAIIVEYKSTDTEPLSKCARPAGPVVDE